MTGFLLFILLIAAVAAGLEAQHRHTKRRGLEAPSAGRRRRPRRRTRAVRPGRPTVS